MTDPETGTYRMKQETSGKTVKIQKQVDEVKDVMENNVTDAMNRGEQLNDLEAKTLALEEGSKTFVKNTKQVSSNLWWKNMKYSAIIVGVIVVVVLIVLFAVYGNKLFTTSSSSGGR